MPTDLVVIQRYGDQLDASHDQAHLQNLGIRAETAEIADENSETGSLHELRVDRRVARDAYRALKEYYESEKDEKFELMGDWGD